MSFNAPPPPPPQQFPEFGPEPTPPKKGKGAAILIGAVAVVVIGVLVVGAMWFLNKSAKPDSMAAPTATVAAEKPSEDPSDKPSATPSEKPKATPSEEPKPASSAAPQWTKPPSPTPTPVNSHGVPVDTYASPEPTQDSVEEYRAAERQRLSYLHCARGNIVVLAETAKHIVSICDVDGSLYYRGKGKKSGANMDLPAYNGGGSAYEASNSSTEYYFDRNRLTVTTGSKVQLDDPIISYRDLSYGNWE